MLRPKIKFWRCFGVSCGTCWLVFIKPYGNAGWLLPSYSNSRGSEPVVWG